MNNEQSTTWKDWVDWWPTYVILGVALASFVHKTKVLKSVTDKLFKREEE